MSTAETSVVEAPLETARFGVPSARANGVTRARLAEVLDFCRVRRIEFLVARCRAEDLAAAQALEEAGARLMDTLVYHEHDLATPARVARPMDVPVRSVRPGEEAALECVASAAFRGYVSHYHADPRLARERCDATYGDWARRCALASSSDAPVLVCEHEGAAAGFAALRRNAPEEGEGVLYGVEPRARGRGLYLALMHASLDWCRASGARRMIISTQLANRVPQRVWARLGFEPYEAHHTFHLWLERGRT